MRERPEDEQDAVRERLRGIWPQARPLPDEDVASWRRLDTERSTGDPPPPVPPAGRTVLAGFDPRRRGIRALVLVAVLVALVAGYLAWRAQPRAEPVPVVVTPSLAPASGPAPGPAGAGDSGAGGAGGGASIVVAVAGRVRHPGLVRLPAGARVQDAIDAAGGALPDTDLSFVNLARKLTDGELVVIGVSPPPGFDPGGAAGNPGAGTASKVNVNTAGLTELDSLPGIGPALAQRIIDYRTAHGGFRSIDELRRVEGIGDAKFAQIKDRVTV